MRLPSLLLLLPFLPSALSVTSSKPNTFIFPGNDAWPEAIATVPGSSIFYTVSVLNGQIFRGTLSTPIMTPFFDGASVGNMSSGVGIKYHRNNLIIAGGASSAAYVFSTRTKKLIGEFPTGIDPTTGVSFLNDLVVDPRSGDVWITDSSYPVIWRLPGEKLRGRDGRVVVKEELELAVDLKGKMPYDGAYNGNGIVLTPGSEYLIVANMDEKALYRVNPKTGEVRKIEVPGDWGSPDGLVYSYIHDTLYVINGAHSDADPGNYVAAIELKKPYLTGKLLRKITSPLLNFASTGAFVEGTRERELLIANFQSARQPNPELPFTIVKIPTV